MANVNANCPSMWVEPEFWGAVFGFVALVSLMLITTFYYFVKRGKS